MDLTYRDALKRSMSMLAQDPLTRFVGYGLKIGRAAGSMADAKEEQLCEFTVAEALMTSAAIGMSLMGLKPVIFYERFDFVPNALDAIVNHLDACETISKGEFRPTAILRIVVGNSTKPLFTGHTHTRDHSEALKRMVRFPVWRVRTAEEVMTAYEEAYKNLKNHSTAIVEYKDL